MDYEMFTDAGNDAVDSIVRMAKMLKMTWPQVEASLYELAKRDEFSEATDTAVREAVYITLGY